MDDPIKPLPGQLQFYWLESKLPPTRSKALGAAWWKGRAAAIAGASLADCPYLDRRAGKRGQVVTFSRAFRKWWRDGFESVTLFPLDAHRG